MNDAPGSMSGKQENRAKPKRTVSAERKPNYIQPPGDYSQNSNGNTSGMAERTERNFEVSARAIEHLLPWVKDEMEEIPIGSTARLCSFFDEVIG